MIDLDIRNGLAEIALNAPAKLNALSTEALAELSQAYDDAAAAGVRALLLRGEGRSFCAGRDLSGVSPENDDARGYLVDSLRPLLKKIAGFPAPTFAAAHGACLGVGLGLLAVTDVVYVAADAKIGSPFANLGAALDSGGHWLFTERLGPHRTLDLIYTAELMSGTEAVAAGLFSRTMDPAELLEKTRAAAMRAASGPTQAFMASKELVAGIRDSRMGYWDALDAENDVQVRLSKTPDYAEGFTAFLAKRKPVFRG